MTEAGTCSSAFTNRAEVALQQPLNSVAPVLTGGVSGCRGAWRARAVGSVFLPTRLWLWQGVRTMCAVPACWTSGFGSWAAGVSV